MYMYVLCMYVYMYVCICVCMYVCMCMCVCVCACVHIACTQHTFTRIVHCMVHKDRHIPNADEYMPI
jgi:hypothetical protein